MHNSFHLEVDKILTCKLDPIVRVNNINTLYTVQVSITLIATGFKRQEESENRSSQARIASFAYILPIFILYSHENHSCSGRRRQQPWSLGLVFSHFPGGGRSCVADPRVSSEERAFRVSSSLNTCRISLVHCFLLSWFHPFW